MLQMCSVLNLESKKIGLQALEKKGSLQLVTTTGYTVRIHHLLSLGQSLIGAASKLRLDEIK